MDQKNPLLQSLLRLFLTTPILLTGIFFSLPTALAATHTWIGGSPLGPNWNIPANWSGGVPSAGDDLVFPSSPKGGLAIVNNLSASSQFNSISFTGLFTPETSYIISGNPIILAHGISDTASGGSQILNLEKILFRNNTAQTFLVNNADESLTIGAINLNGANLVLDGAGNMTMSGTINSNDGVGGSTTGGMITKSGTGNLTLSSAINTYIGLTKITGGTLIINANQTGSNVSVTNANTLAGSGKIGDVSFDSVGTISPGTGGPGILTTGNFNFASGSNYNVDINGIIAGTGYDQILSEGDVLLNNSSLNASLNFSSVAGNNFTIISANNMVSGTFKGLPNGATLTIGTRQFKIAYNSTKVILTDITGVTTPTPTPQPTPAPAPSPAPAPAPTTSPTPQPTPAPAPATTPPATPPPSPTTTPATSPTPALVTVPPGTECVGFTDVSNKDPQCAAITYVKSIGAMTGNPDGTFTPLDEMQRDQVAKIVLKTFNRFDALKDYCNDTSPFPDVTAGDWSYQYICNGKKLGMITGYLGGLDKGNYRPARAVSRVEFLALVLRNLNEPMPNLDNVSYLDVEPNQWYSGYAKFALYQVLFMGQYLHPNQAATREEGAAIIYKLHQQGKL